MCTYITEKVAISGSAKGTSGWMPVSDASVYLDHPAHAPFGHTLNLDFLAPELGPSGRVAVELSQDSARALAKAIQAVLDAAPAGPRIGHRTRTRPAKQPADPGEQPDD